MRPKNSGAAWAIVVACALGVVSSSAPGQMAPGSPSAPRERGGNVPRSTPLRATPASPNSPAKRVAPLAGPRVVERAGVPTLVSREADGRVRRLDISPEEAAIDAMRVEGEAGKALADLFRSRARAMDLFVSQNIDLITKLNSETRPARKGALLIEGLSKLEGLWREGTLEGRTRELLPPERRDEFDALVRGYWGAIVAERLEREPGSRRFQIMLSEKGEGLGRELTSAFQRTQRSGEFIFGYLTRGLRGALALSAEQEKRVRAACERFAEASGGGEGTKAQQATFVLDAVSVLRDPQREVVIATLQGRQIVPPKEDAAR